MDFFFVNLNQIFAMYTNDGQIDLLFQKEGNNRNDKQVRSSRRTSPRTQALGLDIWHILPDLTIPLSDEVIELIIIIVG